MKSTVILFSFVVVVSAKVQEIFQIPENKVLVMQKASDQCAVEHNVDPGLFPRIADGTLPRDEATNKYLYCFARRIGVIDESAHFIVDKMSYLLGDHPLLEEFKEAIKKCSEINKENTLATVGAMNQCYADTVPIRFVV